LFAENKSRLQAPATGKGVSPGRAMEDRTLWHYIEAGSGRPLILLHGIGMSHFAWNAVMPYLSSTRRVIAFDIAGFGRTPSLPKGKPPSVMNLVDELECTLREMSVDIPVDIAGNSLGGYMALETARRGVARSAVAISPAGLWRRHPPPHVKYIFGIMRFLEANFTSLMKASMHMALLRELTLAIPVSAGSRRMPLRDALRALEDLGRSNAFEDTFDNTCTPFRGCDFAARLTVAFGDLDWIFPKGSRYLKRLPPKTVSVEKSGWGHVPMWVDPAGVAQLILQGTQ
jgi:pimeloyl-ACP methyl ester carboxylesterase